MASMLPSRAGQLGSCSSTAQRLSNSRTGQPRAIVVCRSRVLHGEHGHGDHHTPWYQKHKDMWTELDSKSAFAAALAALPAGKLLLVDYYAPWCAVCKTAYPSLCRVADSPDFKQDYVFAKASLEKPEVKDWVKAEGIKGIPHLSVYSSSGAKLLGMGASFKKVEAIKSNLKVIAQHRDEVVAAGKQLELDPNGAFLLLGQEAEAVAAAQ